MSKPAAVLTPRAAGPQKQAWGAGVGLGVDSVTYHTASSVHTGIEPHTNRVQPMRALSPKSRLFWDVTPSTLTDLTSVFQEHVALVFL
jgi:hypothetical protein